MCSRSYNHPEPDGRRIDTCCLAFQSGIIQGIKSSGVDSHIYVPFDLDMWRYLTQDRGTAIGRGAFLLEKNEFDRFSPFLLTHWFYVMDLHSEGTVVDFLIRVRPFLSKSGAKNFIVGEDGNFTNAPIVYSEKLSIYFVQRACNVNNI